MSLSNFFFCHFYSTPATFLSFQGTQNIHSFILWSGWICWMILKVFIMEITLFICHSIYFSSHENLLEVFRQNFQLLSAPVCPVCLLLVTLLNKTFLKKCWTSQFLYIRRTRILAISYAVFLYVQKRNFNLNLLEPLKD